MAVQDSKVEGFCALVTSKSRLSAAGAAEKQERGGLWKGTERACKSYEVAGADSEERGHSDAKVLVASLWIISRHEICKENNLSIT